MLNINEHVQENSHVVIDPHAAAANVAKGTSEASALKRAEENDRVNEGALIFGRHKSMEEAESTYKEQQATITRLQQELAGTKKGQAKPAETPVAPKAAEVPQTTPAPNAPLSTEVLNKYLQEYSEKQELSEASYKELTSVGLGKEVADAYFNGQLAIQQRLVEQVLAPVGGMDQYKKLIEWAQRNIDEASQREFDAAVQDITKPEASAAIQKLSRTYELAHGKFPTAPLEGDTEARGSEATSGYQSYEQMAADMKDPRYSGIGGRKDPAFIRSVQDRVSRSKSL